MIYAHRTHTPLHSPQHATLAREYSDPPGEKMYQPHISGCKRLKCKEGLERTYGPSQGSQVLSGISAFIEAKEVSGGMARQVDPRAARRAP